MLSYICYIHIILYFLHIIYVLPNCVLKQTFKQPVNVKSKSINATIVHDCYFFNENCTNSQTNPLTTMHYFNTPTTNITAMPAIAHHDLPYSNLTDECFTNELTQENTTDSEININNALESINNPEHVDYSTLGNIDPDINFLTEMNSMLCNYYTEFEFNQCFPNINKFSIFNLNVKSLPKNIDKVRHFLFFYFIFHRNLAL